MTDAARADAVLEALSLERQAADDRFFGDLFLRFQRRVACETLTRPAADPAVFDAEAFFADWVEEERGLVGEERARAFGWLARELEFECELENSLCFRPWASGALDVRRRSEAAGGLSSKVNGVETHRSVVARMQGQRILADAGFPTPRPFASRRFLGREVSDGLRNVDTGKPGRR